MTHEIMTTILENYCKKGSRQESPIPCQMDGISEVSILYYLWPTIVYRLYYSKS